MLINTILGGRYEILEEIGKGGMAYVYKARCVLLDRIVAVKVLRDDLEGGEEFLKRFNKEAQAAASLAHPNIVSIFDVGVDNNKHYIVMEHVDGITLKEYITKKGRLDYKEALDITYQIADALEAAHEKNIVHRDIKPHNILITPEKNIKVADFGIARFGTGNTLSADDDILGSVHYISPEQARGESVDNRSDLYSLGISLYEMISGTPPFDADTPVAVAMMQIKDNAKPIVLDDESLPLGVEQITLKAITKELDKRYQNAAEFKNDILSMIENDDFVLDDGIFYYDPDNIGGVTNTLDYDHIPKILSKKKKNLFVSLGALTALLVVIIISLIATGSFGSVFSSIFVGKTNVPSLIGVDFKIAQSLCEQSGFKYVIQNKPDDIDLATGVVISQTPLADEKAKKGTTIEVVVNIEKDYMLKNYIGEHYSDVQQELEDKEYIVNIIFEESKKTEDTVLRQSPSSGSKLRKKSVVTLYVSAGIEQSDNYSTVPTLTGDTYKKALTLLSSCGLSVGSVSGTSSPCDDDMVVGQAIPAGSLVKNGSAVGITVECTHEKDNDTQNDSDDSDNDASSANNTGE